eukprot:Gb_38739 [translate_table: standard]
MAESNSGEDTKLKCLKTELSQRDETGIEHMKGERKSGKQRKRAASEKFKSDKLISESKSLLIKNAMHEEASDEDKAWLASLSDVEVSIPTIINWGTHSLKLVNLIDSMLVKCLVSDILRTLLFAGLRDASTVVWTSVSLEGDMAKEHFCPLFVGQANEDVKHDPSCEIGNLWPNAVGNMFLIDIGFPKIVQLMTRSNSPLQALQGLMLSTTIAIFHINCAPYLLTSLDSIINVAVNVVATSSDFGILLRICHTSWHLPADIMLESC